MSDDANVTASMEKGTPFHWGQTAQVTACFLCLHVLSFSEFYSNCLVLLSFLYWVRTLATVPGLLVSPLKTRFPTDSIVVFVVVIAILLFLSSDAHSGHLLYGQRVWTVSTDQKGAPFFLIWSEASHAKEGYVQCSTMYMPPTTHHTLLAV